METKIKTKKIHKEKLYYVKVKYCGAPHYYAVFENYKDAAHDWTVLKKAHPLNEVWIEEKIITVNRIDIYEEPF